MNNTGVFKSVLWQQLVVVVGGGGVSDVHGALKDSSLLSHRLWSRTEQHRSKGESQRCKSTRSTHINTLSAHVEGYIRQRDTHTNTDQCKGRRFSQALK